MVEFVREQTEALISMFKVNLNQVDMVELLREHTTALLSMFGITHLVVACR